MVAMMRVDYRYLRLVSVPFFLVAVAFVWMHLAILRMERAAAPARKALPELPEMLEIHRPEHALGQHPVSPQPPAGLASRQAPAT